MEPDFSGYATKAGLVCSDGRTIMPEAFQHCDGKRVPLVWQHGHSDPGNVLGYAVLKGRKDGVYTYGYFNDTPAGKNAKALVQHGDITALSIYANKLVERSKQVFHGFIKEVSLVLSGANPGALIENVTISHGDDEYDTLEDEAVIHTGLPLEHENAPDDSSNEEDEDSDKTVQEVFDTLSDEQKGVVHFMIGEALSGADTIDENDLKQADGEPKFGTPEWQAKHGKGTAGKSDKSDDEETVKDVYDSLSEKQKQVVHFMIGAALEEAGKSTVKQSDIESDDDDSVEHADKKSDDEKTVKDVYDSFTDEQKDVVHFMIGAALEAADATVEQSDIQSDDTKSEDENSDNTEGDLNHQEGTDMTNNVFEQNGVTKQERPTLTHEQLQTIVEDAQRSGSLKESFLAHAVEYGIENIDFLFPDAKALSTDPDIIGRRMEWVQSIIGGAKHSPFSRIKSLGVDLTADEARAKGYVKATLKKEEVVKLIKRSTTPTTIYKKQKLDRDDVVDITEIDVIAWLKAEMRVMLDEELARAVLIGDGRDPEDEDKIDEACLRPIAFDDELYAHPVVIAAADTGDDVIEAILRARTNYKGTGNPTLYTTDTTLTDLILLKDTLGRRFYNTEVELASALRVKDIVVVEVMETVPDLIGIIVNIADYTLGADKGGAVSMFDDFDIDYNQLKYLIETRVSGALTKFKSAIVIKRSSAGGVVTPTAPTYNAGTHVITIPTVTGVVYQIDSVTVAAGAQPAITETTEVVAVPAATYAFGHNVDTDWTFVYTA